MNYTIRKELGRGTFGVTYLSTDNTNNKDVALKIIDIDKSKQLGIDLDNIDEEVNVLRDLSEFSCNKFIACYYNNFKTLFNGRPSLIIVSEYVDGGSLGGLIEKNPIGMEHQLLLPLYEELLEGLIYIHDKGYAHRDIKPENILLTRNGQIKYIDFGITCLLRCRIDNCKNTCRGKGGTLLYMPPEFFNSSTLDQFEPYAHDVWSLSVVFWQMALGPDGFPFLTRDINGSFLPERVIMGQIAVAPQLRPNYQFDQGQVNDFLNRITINDYHSRPSVETIQDIFNQTFS